MIPGIYSSTLVPEMNICCEIVNVISGTNENKVVDLKLTARWSGPVLRHHAAELRSLNLDSLNGLAHRAPGTHISL